MPDHGWSAAPLKEGGALSINQGHAKFVFFAHLSTYLSEWSVNTMLLPVSNISTILSYNNNLPSYWYYYWKLSQVALWCFGMDLKM